MDEFQQLWPLMADQPGSTDVYFVSNTFCGCGFFSSPIAFTNLSLWLCSLRRNCYHF